MKINEPDVVLQLFPDEAVIVNLREGVYFSTDGTGADIVGMIAANASLKEMQDLMDARWSDVPREAVPDFMRELFRQHILEAVNPSEASTAAQAFPARDPKLPFVTPKLNVYEDMQQLLLLDPVHDVGEQGWPNRAVTE